MSHTTTLPHPQREGGRVSRAICAGICTAALVCACVPAEALATDDADAARYSKSEVVYASLSAQGEALSSYTVNRFDVTEGGSIVDYGSYDSVKALNDDVELESDGQSVGFDVQDDSTFYYQGTTQRPTLPWDIDVRYTLDGAPVEATDLAGCAGELGITLCAELTEQAPATIAECFVMQVSFTLDASRCSDIVAEGASIAEAGSDVTVTFTVLPGEDACCELTANVSEFEMEGVQIAALPYNSSIDMPETDKFIEQFDELSEAIGELSAGLADISQGMQTTSDATGELAEGDAQFSSALGELSGSFSSLLAASQTIDDGLSELAEGLSSLDTTQLSQLFELASGLAQAADALEELASATEQIDTLSASLESIWEGLGSAVAAVEQAAPDDEEVAALEAYIAEQGSALDATHVSTIEALIAEHEAASALAAAYEASTGSVTLVTQSLSSMQLSSTLATLASELDTAATALAQPAAQLSGLSDALAGITTLAESYGSFDAALALYGSALETLDASYDEVAAGSRSLAAGASQMALAVQALAGGMVSLDESTSGLSDDAQGQIDDMLSDYEYPAFDGTSYASSENAPVQSVQFVLTTAAIELPEEEPVQTDEQELTMWQRLLALFGL